MNSIEFFEKDWDLKQIEQNIEMTERNIKKVKDNIEVRLQENETYPVLNQLTKYLKALKQFKKQKEGAF